MKDLDYKEYETKLRKWGKFKAGPKKGCPCKQATKESVLACVDEVTDPTNALSRYIVVGSNCRSHAKKALKKCCLKKGKKLN